MKDIPLLLCWGFQWLVNCCGSLLLLSAEVSFFSFIAYCFLYSCMSNSSLNVRSCTCSSLFFFWFSVWFAVFLVWPPFENFLKVSSLNPVFCPLVCLTVLFEIYHLYGNHVYIFRFFYIFNMKFAMLSARLSKNLCNRSFSLVLECLLGCALSYRRFKSAA